MTVGAGHPPERGGADFLPIRTATMRKVAAVALPLSQIADPTGKAVRVPGHRRVGPRGTAFRMEQAFHRDRLSGRFGPEAIGPDDDDRAAVHRVVHGEPVAGRTLDGRSPDRSAGS